MLIVLIGPTCCGKSTIGQLLATRIQWDFVEGDAYHPQANIDKMSQGQPLTDLDRWSWLSQLATCCHQQSTNVVLACSALKRAYRDCLRQADTPFIHLQVDQSELETRAKTRSGHFMHPGLIRSQLAIEELLQADEKGFAISACQPVDEIVDEIVARLWTDSSCGISPRTNKKEKF